MPPSELIMEGERQMRICNACRYCEGYCAVFPAMELRRTFSEKDLDYLANLCFDCRDCYYACQYAPPHEFQVNIPKLMSDLRLETYREKVWPCSFAASFKKNQLAVWLSTLGATLFSLLFVLAWQDPRILFGIHQGRGAFYEIIPYPVMVIPLSAIGIYGSAVLFAGLVSFWRETGRTLTEFFDWKALGAALKEALGLVYMQGGGVGCNYPDARFSRGRRWFHHLVFYGFLLALAATVMAAFSDHLLGRPAPYPLLSWTVLLGSLGGFGMLIGTSGLLFLKRKSDRDPAGDIMMGMDTAFLLLLFFTCLTGLLLEAFRSTPAMGLLLIIHFGMAASFLITLPYGKFVHALYRYTALVAYALEQRLMKGQ